MTGTSSLRAASLFAVFLLSQTLACGQTTFAGFQPSGAWNTQSDGTPRGLFVTKRADAMRVKVLDGKKGAAVSPSQAFTTDDKLRVVIESNFESYAYIVSDGHLKAKQVVVFEVRLKHV